MTQREATGAGASVMFGLTGFRLIKIGELAMSVAERALEPLGVTPRQLHVLGTLAADGSLSQQDVSRRLGIDPNVLVGVLDELEHKGLAERRRNPADRRRHLIAVTPDGQALLRDGFARLAAADSAFFAGVPAADLHVLRAVATHLLATHPAPIKRR